ncbi:MAG: glycosyltransferase family 2 protein [Prevotella sp.]|jgi:glycosyltransferase involved in cell wall biosynthesis|nr:glycosyltransferase family 2 protein [Prevotella sp.]
MPMTPLISIITPLYNAEKYIVQTIDSVLAQTYYNWELIIVDDISTDNSYQIAKCYALKNPRIKLIQRDVISKGGAVCRNIGIKASKGKYIIFLDADDLLQNQCLENRVKYMEENSPLDFCVFQMGIISPDGIKENKFLTHQEDNYLYAFLSYKLPWQTTCPIWNSEFFKKNLLGFDEKFPRLQDPELHTRALLIDNVKFKVLDDVSFLDSFYRLIFKKANIPNTLIGIDLYTRMVYDRIKYRIDRDNYIKALFGLYETAIYLYSVSEEDGLSENAIKAKTINYFFYSKKIINRSIYYKTLLFLYYIRLKFSKIPIINMLLLKVGFSHFYGYRFDKKKN